MKTTLYLLLLTLAWIVAFTAMAITYAMKQLLAYVCLYLMALFGSLYGVYIERKKWLETGKACVTFVLFVHSIAEAFFSVWTGKQSK